MESPRAARNLAAVESHFHSEARNEVEAALETFTDDIVWEAPAPNGLDRSFCGKEAVARNYRELFASMRDVKFQFLQRFATEDRVVDDSIVTFEVAKDGYWRFPVGSKIEMRLVHIFEMRDGKISREIVFDMGRPVRTRAGHPDHQPRGIAGPQRGGGAMTKSRQIVLAARPTGMPTARDFRLEESVVPEPGEGEVLVRNIYMSVDPYMRGRMNDRKSYAQPWQVGRPADGRAVGQVVTSRAAGLAEGDFVASMLGWREHFVAPASALQPVDRKLAPLSAYLGVLGIPGFTGWYGLKEIGKPRAGETLVVSGAAGATGSLVAQMGKILGCRVVGTAGTDAKCAWLTGECGIDAALNYRKAGDLFEALRQACPQGIDVYFENVGGAMLDAVLRLINPFARIPLCGMISQYNLEVPDPGPRHLFSLIGNRGLMQGFIISDHLPRYPEFVAEVAPWVKAGRLKYQQTVVEGIDKAVQAFLGLFSGDNTGKMLVKLGPEPR